MVTTAGRILGFSRALGYLQMNRTTTMLKHFALLLRTLLQLVKKEN